MNTTGLYDAFRSDVVDTARPYLWTEDEVWRYMNDAYFQFVRKTGGVADFTSDACVVDIVPFEPTATLHKSVMRIMSATRRSDKQPLEIINGTDIGRMRSSDYGQTKQLVMDEKIGPVRYMVHGLQRGVVRWVQVPEAADVVDLHIYRMPLVGITGAEQELTDVDEEHHVRLLDWMKHLAYKKQDAETFNPKASAANEESFLNYCAQVKAEWERYKHKTRVVAYGGL